MPTTLTQLFWAMAANVAGVDRARWKLGELLENPFDASRREQNEYELTLVERAERVEEVDQGDP